MEDFNYINSLSELPASPTANASYKVTRDWGTTTFNPAGKRLTIYVLHGGFLTIASGSTFGNGSGIHVMGTVKIAGTVTLGENTRLTVGESGMIIPEEKSTSTGPTLLAKECYFDAPIKQVFGDGLAVTGIWEIPTAYPQWFTPMIPKLTSDGPNVNVDSLADDWAIPINRAIKMKGVGEVFLVKGVYNVKTPITMSPGIQLRGTCGINYDDITEAGHGATIIRANVEGKADSPYDKFILYINVNKDEQAVETGPFQAGTAVENIVFKTATYSHPRCIIVGCPCNFNNLGFRYYRQAIKYLDGVYCDGRRITNCNSMDWFSSKVANSDDTYIFDIYTNGDACVIEGVSVTSKKYKALKVGNSCGTVIQGCIFNAPVYLRFCKATVFTGNHMESDTEFNLETQLIISNSDVLVQGNYFEKSKVPSIIIKDGEKEEKVEYFDTSVVTLTDNQFVYTTGKRNSNENSDLSVLKARIKSINEHDIQKDVYSIVNLSNNFRNAITNNGSSPTSYPFGLSIKFPDTKDTAGNVVINKFVDFNDKSFCLSQQCCIAGTKIVSSYVILSENQTPLSSIKPDTNFKWLIGPTQDAIYTYQYRVYTGGNQPSGDFKGFTGNTISTHYGGNGVTISVNLQSSGGRGYVELKRSYTVDKTTKYSTVKIPICGARKLFDNGIAIAGFKWDPED